MMFVRKMFMIVYLKQVHSFDLFGRSKIAFFTTPSATKYEWAKAVKVLKKKRGPDEDIYF